MIKQSFFLGVKPNNGRESHFFQHFCFFFAGKNLFSRPLFTVFSGFFTPIVYFHARVFFIFSRAKKLFFTGKIPEIFAFWFSFFWQFFIFFD